MLSDRFRRRGRPVPVVIVASFVAAVALAVLITGRVLSPDVTVRSSASPVISHPPADGQHPRPPIAAAVPPIDPIPWSAVDWRRIQRPFGADPDPALNRIDGLIAGGPGLIGWGRVHRPGRNQFNDMGAIYLSPDGVAWTVVPVDDGVGALDTSEFHLVTDGPGGLLVIGNVCCAEERTAMWRSGDGLVWERVPWPVAIALAESTSLTSTEDGYVLAGRSNGSAAIWTSMDGRAWVPADAGPAGFGAGAVNDVALTPDGLVAVGWLGDRDNWDGAVWQSADGRSWSRIRVDLLEGKADTTVGRVVVWAGGWLLLGEEGSHEDRTKCEQMGRVASAGRSDAGSEPTRDLTCGWSTETRWVTRDVADWRRVQPAWAVPGGVPGAGELIEFRLVDAGGPGLVALGEGAGVGSAAIFASADGVTWQPTAPRDQFPSGIVPSGFVVAGRAIAAVADGPSAWIGTVR